MKHASIAVGVLLACSGQWAQAGAACVVAKRLGDSLAVEWVAAEDRSAQSALEQAKQNLHERGLHGRYHGLHPQALSPQSHAHGVIVKTEYESRIGKRRTSYGCGFSAFSAQHARELALENLRNYSWGWRPEFGYQVMERFRY
jgi:hypothetical protein